MTSVLETFPPRAAMSAVLNDLVATLLTVALGVLAAAFFLAANRHKKF